MTGEIARGRWIARGRRGIEWGTRDREGYGKKVNSQSQEHKSTVKQHGL